MITNIGDLKYGPAIREMLKLVIGECENDAKLIELTNNLLELSGTTLKQLDEDIDIGVQNGQSVEKQLFLVKHIINLRNKSGEDK